MKTRSNFSNLIIKLYKYCPSRLRKIIESYLSHVENGWYFSETLREIYKDIYGIDIGLGSYGCFVSSRFPPGTIIGRYCSIARNVTYLNANHPMERASMHPMFYDSRLGADKKYALKRCNLRVGNDVWIGQDVIITKSCKFIGNGAIVGAGSVVTKDVSPYSVVAGNPAKPIKQRFDNETIYALEDSKWYELSPDKLKSIANLIDKPLLFASKAKEMKSNERL